MARYFPLFFLSFGISITLGPAVCLGQVETIEELITGVAERTIVEARDLDSPAENRERDCFECDVRVLAEASRKIKCEEAAPGRLVRSYYSAIGGRYFLNWRIRRSKLV